MAYKDLREFIAALEARGALRRIKAEVDAELEITEITDRVSKMTGADNVALLFENVRGYDMPILMNAFGSYERMALALGVEKLDDIAEEIRALMRLPYISFSHKMDLISLIPMARKAINFPKYVSHAPCQEVIEKDHPSLDILPILKCWPEDGGPFVTLPLVFTKNPETDKRNVGMYRLQKYDATTTGMHWHIHKNGAENYRAAKAKGMTRLEAAVAIGTDPAVTYAATAPLPRDIDEMVFAGFLRHKSVELTKCVTVDLEVPATSEIVLEGYVNIDERRREVKNFPSLPSRNIRHFSLSGHAQRFSSHFFDIGGITQIGPFFLQCLVPHSCLFQTYLCRFIVLRHRIQMNLLGNKRIGKPTADDEQ